MGSVFKKPSPPVPAAPIITQEAQRQPQQQATREPTETERRIAAVQGQPNLTSVLTSGFGEDNNAERARRKALGA